MHNWGIRKRVLAIALVPAATIALLLTAYFTHAQVGALEQAAQRRGHGLAQRLAAAAGHAAMLEDRQALSRLASALIDEPDVLEVVLSDASGRTLVRVADQTPVSGSDLAFRYPIRSDPTPSDGQASRIATRDTIGWATVHLSRQTIQRSKQRIVFTSVLIAVLGLTLSAFFARRLGRDVIEPVIQLTGAVREIGNGRFDTRVHTASSGELKALERGINRMGAALEEMQHSMQNRVDQATEDLRQTLERLEEQNRQLEIARAQASEGNRIKAEFLANISHEIRTPMNAITGFTNLLLKSPLDREQRDYACTVRDAANSLLTIINDILDFSRIAAGDLQLDHTPFDLRQVVDGAIAIMAPAAYDKHLDLTLLFYTDVPERLRGDAVRIRQVLMHLIGNAIKFTRRGRIVVRVMIEDQIDEEVQLRISVQDTGIGLDDAEQQRLFAAFAQADASATREVGGVGIGLVICKQLAERMGGTIGMESARDVGSTFWFTLRADLQTDAALEIGPLEPFAGVRAAVYERDELQRSGLAAQLRSWGVLVETVTSFAELEYRLTADDQTAHAPDVVFMGLRPEELEESAVDNFLNHSADHPRAALVVMMNTVNRRLLEEAVASGAACSLPKIASRDELRAVINQALSPGLSYPRGDHGAVPSDLDRTPPNLSSVRVLVVDDNSINRKLMCTLYAKAGAVVDAAADGEQALRMFTATRYDLVFMDIQMPGLNGIETTERVRVLERESRRTPVIAVTAAALRGERERLIRAGFDDCIIKPVHENELWELAHKWLPPQARDACEPGAYGTIDEFWSGVAEPGPDDPYDNDKRAGRRRAIRIAGGNEQLANELFKMLLTELPDMQRRLNAAYQQQQLDALESEAHKLHGAASYCAVDPLRTAAALVERAAKQHDADLSEHIDHLNRSIERLLAEYADASTGK